MQIAILSSNFDKSCRGYENYCKDVLTLFKEEKAIHICLYKGYGRDACNEIVVGRFHRSKIINFIGRNTKYGYEFRQIVFTLEFIFKCLIERIKLDRIVVIEPMVSKILYKLRKIIIGKPKIIFTHGVKMDPVHYHSISDIVHEVNIENFNKAKHIYPHLNKFFLLPHFSNPNKKSKLSNLDKDMIRSKFGITSQKVLLSVGLVDSHVKRMNYIVNEVSKLNDDWGLVICGPVAEPDLISLAQSKLKNRFWHFYLQPHEICDLYVAADLFAFAAINEGFGLVTIEAMQNQVPVVVHKRELNQWIVADNDLLIDMTVEGELTNFISSIKDDEWLTNKGKQAFNNFEKRFSQNALKEQYTSLILAD